MKPIKLDFKNYQTSYGGDDSTSNNSDLSVFYQGDWEFKDITSETSTNLIWWSGQVEAYSSGTYETTTIRVSHVDDIEFDLSDIGSLREEGAGVYKLINDQGYQYEIYSASLVNMSDPESYFNSRIVDELDENILKENFSSIKYFDIEVTAGVEVHDILGRPILSFILMI